MENLQFGEITIDQLFDQHKKEVYENVIKSIEDCHEDCEITKINVVDIITNGKRTRIDLSRGKWINMLKSCEKYFKSIEDYRTCHRCIQLISALEENKNLKLNGI